MVEQKRELGPVKEGGILGGVELDQRLLMAAKAIQLMQGKNKDGTPKINEEMALAAAIYQAGTGQLLGRDFYVENRMGRMEGYRGVARDANERGVGEVDIRYRPFTADENAEHEIKSGDTAKACEVSQLRAWRIAQQSGVQYHPIVGYGGVGRGAEISQQVAARQVEVDRVGGRHDLG
jgi:hypothetical protein